MCDGMTLWRRDGASYRDQMDARIPHLILKIETKDPIELGDFVTSMTGMAAQFQKYVAKHHPDLESESTVYVRQIKEGSIIAELIPIIGAVTFPEVAAHMENVNIIRAFTSHYAKRITAYFKRGGRDPSATKSDLSDVMGAVAAIAKDPKANSSLSAVWFEKTEKKTQVALKFNDREAKRGTAEMTQHRLELEKRSEADRPRVLMVFKRIDKGKAAVGKKSGEQVIIQAIDARAMPLVYATELVEARIKSEIADTEENIFKKAFEVDVNIEEVNGKAVAYRVTHVHAVISLP